jgi:hypothetical protein
MGGAHDHFMPTKKGQLLQYFAKKYPADVAKFRAMPMQQLLAIWHKLWADQGHTCCLRAYSPKTTGIATPPSGR